MRALVAAVVVTMFAGGAVSADERRAALERMVLQDCGSCHGMRLTGGLGPPLTAEALRDKPRDSLVAIVLVGRRGTPMPPWAPFMSEAEAAWIVDRLVEGAIHAR